MRILGAALLLLAAAAFAEEREITACEVCGGEVYQTPQSYVSGNTKYIYIDEPAHKRYCTRCQRDINNGVIDATDRLSPRDAEEPGDNPYGNRHAVEKFDWEKPKPPKDAQTREAESGMGALPWIAGIVLALVLFVRFFLKS